MYVSYDPKAQATYVEIEDDITIVRTVHIGDRVMVDVDAQSEPVGVEFVASPDRITQEMVDSVIVRFPQLKGMHDMNAWLLQHA